MDVVPTWLKLSHLEWLTLGFNSLMGSIPAALSNLTRLGILDLSNGNLKGKIPPELSLMQELSYLYLGSNQLTGEIPASVGNLSKLSYLYLGRNQLRGQVPTTLGKNEAMNVLHLQDNNLEGGLDFLLALSNCRQLQQIVIQKNSFTGLLHGNVENLTSRLTAFVADDNKLIGGLPVSISNISNLEWIGLSTNLLTEPIPESISTLENLVYLDLSQNGMLGRIQQKWVSSGVYNGCFSQKTISLDLYLAALVILVGQNRSACPITSSVQRYQRAFST